MAFQVRYPGSVFANPIRDRERIEIQDTFETAMSERQLPRTFFRIEIRPFEKLPLRVVDFATIDNLRLVGGNLHCLAA